MVAPFRRVFKVRLGGEDPVTTRPTRDRGIARSIATLLSGTMAAQLVTLAATPILSRVYGPGPFGEFALFVSATTLIAILGTLRYEMAIVLPRSQREAAAIARLGTCLLALVAIGITAVSVLILVLPLPTSPAWTWLVLLSGPGVFVLGYLSFSTQWFTRAGRYRTISRNRVVQSVVTAAAQLTFGMLMPTTGAGLGLGLLTGQVAGALVFYFESRSTIREIDTRTRRWRYLLRKYRRLPLLLTPHTLVDSLRLNGVNLLVGYYSVGGLGQYSQAWRLVQVPASLVGSAVSQVYFPRLASAARDQLSGIVRDSVIRSLALGAVPFVLIFFLSPSIFPLILGEEWAMAGQIAQALAPALYLNLAASPISTIFVVLRKEHIGLTFSALYTALSLGALAVFSHDLLRGIWTMSLVQAVALALYIGLATSLARRPPGRLKEQRSE